MRTILLFGHRPYPNDHAVLEAVYGRELPRRGFRPVWVLQPRTADRSGGTAEWHGAPVYVTRRRHWRGPLRHAELLREYLRLGAYALSRHPIDVVQARTGLPEALAAALLARRFGKPFVYQYSFPIPLGRRESFRPGLRPLANLAYGAETALVRLLMRRASLVLAVSEAMAAELRGHGIERLAAFPLGADLLPEHEAPPPASGPTLVYFGSLDRKRRLGFLLDVLAAVRERMPGAELLLLGDPAEGDLRERVVHLGLADAVRFAGRVPRSEVPRHVRGARCSVAPIPPTELYRISSATKVVESLALGVPVVANREIPEQRELIEASGGGMAPPYEREAFAEAVLALLGDAALAARQGRDGRRYVAAHRSYAVLSEKLIGYYEAVLARPTA